MSTWQSDAAYQYAPNANAGGSGGYYNQQQQWTQNGSEAQGYWDEQGNWVPTATAATAYDGTYGGAAGGLGGGEIEAAAAAGGAEEVTYYWDEETQMYYYWDETLQAYVGWVEEEVAPEEAAGPAAPPATAAEVGKPAGIEQPELAPLSPRVILSPRTGGGPAIVAGVRNVPPSELIGIKTAAPEAPPAGYPQPPTEIPAASEGLAAAMAAVLEQETTAAAQREQEGMPVEYAPAPGAFRAQPAPPSPYEIEHEPLMPGAVREPLPPPEERIPPPPKPAPQLAGTKLAPHEAMEKIGEALAVGESISPTTAAHAELVHDLAESAKDAAARRASVRQMTRKLTVTAKGRSLADQLQALAEARAEAGVEVPDEAEIQKRQRMAAVRAMAREKAGLISGAVSSSVSDVESWLKAAPGAPPAAAQPPSSSSETSPPTVKEAPTARTAARRGTARFGTAHFKDVKMAEGLEALLARKVK